MAVLVLAVAVAAGSACGGDGNGAAEGTRAKRAIQTEAQKRAESMVLELSDFPDGWRASPSENEETEDMDRFRKCLGSDYSALTIIGEADSKDFANEDTTEASSDATVFASEGQAEEAIKEVSDGMQGDAAEDCFRDLIAPAVKKESPELEVGDVDIGELRLTAPRDITETRAWQIAVSLEVKSGEARGSSATVYLDLMTLREGDSLATVKTQDVVTPFNSESRNKLLQALAGRMSQAGST
ncbi:MAG TPA: hypothetical protein VGQ68_05200 [Gaiellaceae bacterium]|jgi:hypothetical protein|nr:hypothetical protein [Gaiellaceae bacterium]